MFIDAQYRKPIRDFAKEMLLQIFRKITDWLQKINRRSSRFIQELGTQHVFENLYFEFIPEAFAGKLIQFLNF